MASKPPVILSRRAAARRVEGRTLMIQASAIAVVLAVAAPAARAQLDCDRYPAGSARQNACYREEAQRAREDMENAYERRQREAIDQERRDERQLRLDREQADPDEDRDSDR
jgi:uncharacterized protein YecT (DUF1311 family)